jgi:hypothetical protein
VGAYTGFQRPENFNMASTPSKRSCGRSSITNCRSDVHPAQSSAQPSLPWPDHHVSDEFPGAQFLRERYLISSRESRTIQYLAGYH